MRVVGTVLVATIAIGCTHPPVQSVHVATVVGEDRPFVPATAVSYTYAGIAWGSDGETVKQALASVGLTFTKIDRDGDLNFVGSQLGYDAAGMALMARGHVLKVAVNLATPDSKAREVYEQMVDSLTGLFGHPTLRYHTFRPPYREGDGNEIRAIRTGNATVSSLWLREADGSQVGDDIAVEITQNLTVQVSYEANAWEREANRRKLAMRSGRPMADTGKRRVPRK